MTPDEFAKKLPGAFATMREQLMTKVTLAVLAKSQKRTPVRTGALRRSETTRVEDEGRRGFVGTNVVYAPFVHARVPFFELGIEDARPQIERLMEQAGESFFAGVSK